MHITSKSRYGLKIMIHLTDSQERLTRRSDIASQEGIPIEYIDQIIAPLRNGGLIESTRGPNGGYRLAKPAAEISVLEIFKALEDPIEPVQCLDEGIRCVAEHVCSSKEAWGIISRAMNESLAKIILRDLVPKKTLSKVEEASVANIQECRPPRRH